MNTAQKLDKIKSALPEQITLVAVSKTQSVQAIREAVKAGQQHFGENRVRELVEKAQALRDPSLQWHMIGHLQRNKVKHIAAFVSLIHAVDRFSLLEEIDRQAAKHKRVIPVLLQLKIAREASKFGLSELEILDLLQCEQTHALQNVEIKGLMGMASFTENRAQITAEFRRLNDFFYRLKADYELVIDKARFTEKSIGMSGDYKLAIRCGSTLVRIGSAIFGPRG